MKIGTMSIVCGTTACNARCPFCVSKMTPDANLNTDVNWRNLGVACKLAEKAGATTCLITGKGEPTLYPDLITKYIEAVADTFPFIELQTNGMKIKELNETETSVLGKLISPEYWSYLKAWYEAGLTTVCLSAVETGFANKKIYGDDYPALEETIKMLHDVGFSVRLSVMMLKRYICKPHDIDRLVKFCKDNQVEQLTVRPIAYPDFHSEWKRSGVKTFQEFMVNNPTRKWVEDHMLRDFDDEGNRVNELKNIVDHIERKGHPVLKLSHGATVYDFDGQNICLSNCLTTNDTDENMRQIIFYPDGTIGYDWKYKGARLL